LICKTNGTLYSWIIKVFYIVHISNNIFDVTESVRTNIFNKSKLYVIFIEFTSNYLFATSQIHKSYRKPIDDLLGYSYFLLLGNGKKLFVCYKMICFSVIVDHFSFKTLIMLLFQEHKIECLNDLLASTNAS
jgi:hypothetical protein